MPVTAGREYDLKVEYTGEAMTAALTTKINVKTDDARQKSLDIQVWGRPDPGMTPVRTTAMPPTSLRPATATPVALPAPPSP